jgi:hypothetical protein
MSEAWLPAPLILDVNYSSCHEPNVIEPPEYNSISHLLIKNYSYVFLHVLREFYHLQQFKNRQNLLQF